jgi:hypothetical protein
MQATQHILLIRPSGFAFNNETALSNAFQQKTDLSQSSIRQKVAEEFDVFVKTLRLKGVNVLVIDDTELPPKPDAVFPNNWASYHGDGTVILYPMCTPNRRLEKRPEIISTICQHYSVNNIIDLSEYELKNRFLEGTGSIIFDHDNRIAYACLSPRTDKALFEQLSKQLNYKPISFYAHNQQGIEIYHTNVMMCIAEKFAVICLESISNKEERELVTQTLSQTGYAVIDISFGQMNRFAGNMLALKSIDNKNLLAMSQSAFDSLTTDQKSVIEQYCEMVPLSIPTIETIGGGSARCMIAEIFLPLLT